MNTRQLHFFLQVAKDRSFNKAALHLYISVPTVMNQMNKLEEELGTRLFIRTHTGLILTTAGRLTQQKAELILQQVTDLKHEITKQGQPQLLKIGTSLLNPAPNYSFIWNDIEKQIPNTSYQYVPINDKKIVTDQVYDVDLQIFPYDSSKVTKETFSIPIGTTKFYISLLRNNPLAKQKSLKIQDLINQQIYLPRMGRFQTIDQLREKMIKNGINVKNTSDYSLNTFNVLREGHDCLLSLGIWQTLQPDIISISLHTSARIQMIMRCSNNLLPYKRIFRTILKKHHQELLNLGIIPLTD